MAWRHLCDKRPVLHLPATIESHYKDTRQHNGPVFTHIGPNTTWFKKSFLYHPNRLQNIADHNSFKSANKRALLNEEILLYF